MSGNAWVVLPLACLAGGVLVTYVAARLLVRRNDLLALLTASIMAAALGSWALLFAAAREMAQPPVWGYLEMGGAFLCADPGSLVVAGVALGLGTLVAIYSGRYLALDRRYETYYPLLLLLLTGLVGMALAGDLFNLYLFCELMSVAAYALVAFRRHTDTAIEAGFKYLIMGSLGTAIMLMGISFIYRQTGQLAVPAIAAQAGLWDASWAGGGASRTAQVAAGPWARAGLACYLVGLGVKSAVVPLHTWLPDAHGRAPSSISAMLSGIVVQSALYAALKVGLGWGGPARGLGTLLIALSMLNMTLGNGMALVQTHTKRLLAYSTIAQMGYVMFSIGVGLRCGIPAAVQAGFFLLVAHAGMKGLAFLSKGVCHFYCHTTAIAELRGTARQLPLVAVALSVALGGLAGVPPLAGFAAKWFMITRVLGAADVLVYVGLGVLVLNTLIGLGYYLPLIGMLFALPLGGDGVGGHGVGGHGGPPLPSPQVGAGHGAARVAVSPWMVVPLLILGGIVLAMGLYPGPWLDLVARVGDYLLALGE